MVVYRDTNGRPQVLSAYCAHLGTDLSEGCVENGEIICPLHRWGFDRQGMCTRTGTGLVDPPPSSARLFPFPTAERFGLVWAFNGTEPLWELPDLRFPDDELVFHVGELGEVLNIDPWVFCCNTADLQHLETLHGIDYDKSVLLSDDIFSNTEYSAFINLSGDRRGDGASYDYGVWGTSFFTLSSEINGRWYAVIDALAMPAPGKTHTYIIGIARKTGDPLADAQHAAAAFDWEREVLIEDAPVLRNQHFRPGPQTKSDRSVARFYEYLRRYPRAHPAVDYIN